MGRRRWMLAGVAVGLAMATACGGDRAPRERVTAKRAVRPPKPPREVPLVRQPADTPATWFVPHALLDSPQPGRPDLGGEAIAMFDVDVDGRQDVVLVNGTDHIYAYANRPGPDGPRFVLHPTAIGPTGSPHQFRAKGLGLHDLDRDGALDLFVATQGEGEPVQYRRKARAAADRGALRRAWFTTRRNARDGTFPFLDLGVEGAGAQRTVLFADLDGDGLRDAFRITSAYWGPYYAGGREGPALQRGRADGTFGPDELADATVGPADLWHNADGHTELNLKAAVVRDFDGDGRPDVVMGAFADVWANWKSEVITSGEGFQGTWRRGLFVLHNESDPGHLRLREVGNEAMPGAWGLEGTAPVHAILPADVDLDGDLDLLLGSYRGRNGHGTSGHGEGAHVTPGMRLLRNDSIPGTIRFTDVSDAAGFAPFNDPETLPEPYPVDVAQHGTVVRLWPAPLEGIPFDVDLDGDVDALFIDRQILRRDGDQGGNLGLSSFLWRNDGTGRFTLVDPAEHGLVGTGRAVMAGDVDGDGRLDVVTTDGSGGGAHLSDRNHLWLNRVPTTGGHLFVEATTDADPWGVGTVVDVVDPAGRRVAHDEIRTDVCYRSRRDAAVHVGTGDARQVTVTLTLPEGRIARCEDVRVDRRVRFGMRDGRPGLFARPTDGARGTGRPAFPCVWVDAP